MRIVLAAWLLATATPAFAEVCPAWKAAETIGRLDTGLVNEASGLEVSARFEDRLYHNNDSGDGLRFYVSRLDGQGARAVEVEGSKPIDMEEISLGPCGEAGDCLYLGDIGDNPARRDEVVFTLVREVENFPDKVSPLRVVRARYPDGAHNAEAFAVHPNGDLYLVTKPADRVMMNPAPAQVYRLTAAQLADATEVQTFEKIGEIDLPKIMGTRAFPGSIATALDISADGRRAILLTYMAALEIGFDFKDGVRPFEQWKEGQDYRVVELDTLPQQEAAAWLPDGSGFLYDTELTRGSQSAPIRKVDCAR